MVFRKEICFFSSDFISLLLCYQIENLPQSPCGFNFKIETNCSIEQTTRIFAKNCLNNSDLLLKRIEMLKCCKKKKKWKVENLTMKNIYFWSHTLTNFKSKLWNDKNTLQTTSKTIFRNLFQIFIKGRREARQVRQAEYKQEILVFVCPLF